MRISDTDNSGDPRLGALTAWIDGIPAVTGSDPVAASSDASFRRYFRLQKGAESFIVMDAPPPQEDCLPFVRVAGFLQAMQLNAPRIIEADIDNGFLLITDLGSEQYLKALREAPERKSSLYEDAIDALLVLQRRGEAYQSSLPKYDEALLRFELSLFWDWLCAEHLGLVFSTDDQSRWASCCEVLVRNATDQPQVFVHRDYHSRNLMVCPEKNPGILDFQDAVEGPLTYDLVSLLKDCYVTWPENDVRHWALRFYENLSEATRSAVDERQFRRYFELTGVQRHLKAAGIFCRLCHRDGKSAYLADIPQTLDYIIEMGPNYEELNFLSTLLRKRVLPALDGHA